MTTILIADDQALVRVGLCKILESEAGMVVVAEAVDGHDAVAAAARWRPDVVLMDIRMPVLDGIEATRRTVGAHPSTRVLILTTFGLDGYVFDALRAGASGFMLKDAAPEEILAAVRIVANGEALLAPAVTRTVIEEFARQRPAAAPAPPQAVSELTPREREVLNLLIGGYSNTEICNQLVISEATTKTHVAHILHRDPRQLLCLIALLLALAEIADAFFVSFPPGPAVFAMMLLAGTLWTIRRDGRGGPSLLAALFAFEIANAPFWPRHGTGDWVTSVAYGLAAVAGLLLATRAIFGARHNETRAAQLAA